MALLVGQLIYTSFAKVGFQTLTSAEVPPDVRQAFLEQIVYQYWDSYNPPPSNYRAVYLHRIAIDRFLFGWLYNDGADDLGRSHTPYFICYYLAETSPQLSLIFDCLAKGTATFFDRQSMPGAIEQIVIDQNYAALRPGIAIADHFQPQQDKLFLSEPSLEALISPAIRGGQSEIIGTYQTPIKGILAGAIALLLVGSFYLSQNFSIAPPSIEQITTPKILSAHSDSVWSVLVKDKTLISGSSDRTIKLWNLETGTVLQTLSGHTDTIRSLTSDGKILISGSGDRTIKLWNLETYQLLQTLEQNSPVWSVAVSSDRQTLVSGSEDGMIKIWKLPTGELRQTIRAHVDRIFSVALSSDSKTLATAGLDHTIKLWDIQTGQLLRTITGHTEAVRTLAFSPDGTSLVSGSWDTTIKLWNWQTSELLHTFTGHTSRVVTVAFSSDGQTLVSGSLDRTIRIWSMQSKQSQQVLTGHHDWVLAIALTPNQIISGSKDQTIRIWQLSR